MKQVPIGVDSEQFTTGTKEHLASTLDRFIYGIFNIRHLEARKKYLRVPIHTEENSNTSQESTLVMEVNVNGS